MSTLFPKPITIKRGTRILVRGVWSTTYTDSTILGSVQPLSGEDIDALDPGTRNIGRVWVYTGSLLNIRREGSTDAADRVVFDGSLWEVTDCRPYTNGIIPHRKYLAEYRGPAT